MSCYDPAAARAERRREQPVPPPYAGYLNEAGILVPPALAIVALGIDPGPVPGFFLALWRPGEKKADWARAYQCNADGAEGLLAYILTVHGSLITCGQIEEFRTGRGPGTRGHGASVTREMLGTLTAQAADRGLRLAVRHSSQVMPWTGEGKGDKRLKAAGIFEATNQLPHARAASRHCLYVAVADGGLPDPLSRRTS